MNPFLNESVFPKDILQVLSKHMKKPKSATVRDVDLVKVLRTYDQASDTLMLSEIPEGADFEFNRRVFNKGEKLRTRFRCTENRTGKVYLISGIAEVNLS